MRSLSERNKEILSRLPQEEQSFFYYFLLLTETPHGTFKTLPLFNEIVSIIRHHGFDPEIQEDKHIIVRIPSTGQSSTVIALQAHVDMVQVGELVDEKIEVDYDGEVLVAKKSSLGADDGFGVALILDVIQHWKNFLHPNLEIILTTDEEVSFAGIMTLPKTLKFEYLINLDSLSSETIFIGALSTLINKYNFKGEFEKQSGNIVEFKISGLNGGHSGLRIKDGGGNAIKWGVRILNTLSDFKIISINGGEKVNSIPVNFSASLLVKDAESTMKKISSVFQDLSDRSFELPVLELNKSFGDALTLDQNVSQKMLDFVTILHYGPIKESLHYKGKYESLQCVCTMKISPQELSVIVNTRSLYDSDVEDFRHQADIFCRLTGSTCENILDVLPWSPKKNPVFALQCQKIFEAVNGRSISFSVMNATVEVSYICMLGYHAEMIAVCPSVPLAHSVGEYMNVDDAIKQKTVVLKLLEAYA